MYYHNLDPIYVSFTNWHFTVLHWNMASGNSKFLCEDEFDAIVVVTDTDIIQPDDELNLEIN